MSPVGFLRTDRGRGGRAPDGRHTQRCGKGQRPGGGLPGLAGPFTELSRSAEDFVRGKVIVPCGFSSAWASSAREHWGIHEPQKCSGGRRTEGSRTPTRSGRRRTRRSRTPTGSGRRRTRRSRTPTRSGRRRTRRSRTSTSFTGPREGSTVHPEHVGGRPERLVVRLVALARERGALPRSKGGPRTRVRRAPRFVWATSVGYVGALRSLIPALVVVFALPACDRRPSPSPSTTAPSD